MNSRLPSYQPVWFSLGFGSVAAGLGAILGYLVATSQNSLVIAAAVFGAVLALITVVRVELGLLALILMTYTRLSDIGVHFYNAPSIAKLFIALLVVAILLRWAVQGRTSRGWERAALLVGVYGVIVFASMLYASDYTRAANTFSDYLKDGIITIIVVILLQRGPVFRQAIWMLLIAGIFMGTLSVYQYLTSSFDNNFLGFAQVGLQNIVGETSGYRIAGPIGDPNYYAQIMLVLIPMAFNRMMAEKNILLKLAALWALAVCGLSVVFTFSRGAFLGMAVMLVILAIYHRPRPLEVLVALVIGVFLLRYVPEQYTARLQTLPNVLFGQTQVQTDVSFRGRASELIAAWMMFVDHPILGVGVQNYEVNYQKYSRQIGFDQRSEGRQPHNLVLEVASETGLAGLLVFGFLLWQVFRGMWRAWKRLREAGNKDYAEMVLGFIIAMIGYLSAAMFIHAAYPRFFWLLAGIALALPQVADDVLTSGRQTPDGR